MLGQRPLYDEAMVGISRLFCAGAVATVLVSLVGCGASGPTFSGPRRDALHPWSKLNRKPSWVASRPACSLRPAHQGTQTCRSPDGRWLLLVTTPVNAQDCRYLYFGHTRYDRRVRFAAPESCGLNFGNDAPGVVLLQYGGTWIKPHLLLIGDSNHVALLDPVTRQSKLIASLGSFLVSPNGEWIVGNGAGGTSSVYVVAVRQRKCLEVPIRSDFVAGFSPDSKDVVVYRRSEGIETNASLRRFPISSLRAACPTGPAAILPTSRSQSYVDVHSPAW